MTAPAAVDGFVAPGFERVLEEFRRNFAERGEVGAAFAAVRAGEPVVELWGGIADRGKQRPWAEDTLQAVFSGTKGLVAICVLIALDRGLLELEAPVSRYWPEFGKEEILVRDVVGHTARLPGITHPVSLDEFADPERMASLLEVEAPSEDPRARLCYHAFTYGWLCAELIRRTDGRSLARFFADEVAARLELELWIGLPDPLEERVSRIELAPTWPLSLVLDPETHLRDPLVRSIWGNPPTLAPEGFAWNSRTFHAAEIPGAGAIGTARSIADLYGNLERLLSPPTLELARTSVSEGWDEAHATSRRYGVGFELQTMTKSLGPPADAFGHGGAGGSSHGYWPELRVGFSYAMNLMRDDKPVDARPQALLTALHRSVSLDAFS
jgi:CubicO group peptidase (beta-lactamase class C family)